MGAGCIRPNKYATAWTTVNIYSKTNNDSIKLKFSFCRDAFRVTPRTHAASEVVPDLPPMKYAPSAVEHKLTCPLPRPVSSVSGDDGDQKFNVYPLRFPPPLPAPSSQFAAV